MSKDDDGKHAVGDDTGEGHQPRASSNDRGAKGEGEDNVEINDDEGITRKRPREHSATGNEDDGNDHDDDDDDHDDDDDDNDNKKGGKPARKEIHFDVTNMRYEDYVAKHYDVHLEKWMKEFGKKLVPCPPPHGMVGQPPMMDFHGGGGMIPPQMMMGPPPFGMMVDFPPFPVGPGMPYTGY